MFGGLFCFCLESFMVGVAVPPQAGEPAAFPLKAGRDSPSLQ
jgi:hypothetical protein